MILKLDAIYWLNPKDKGDKISIHGNRETHGEVNRNSVTFLYISIPEEDLFTIAYHFQKPERAIVKLQQSLRAKMINGEWICEASFPAVNSGSVQTPWGKRYNMQRDLFIVPHLRHDGCGHALIVWSLKDKSGFEIATAKSR